MKKTLVVSMAGLLGIASNAARADLAAHNGSLDSDPSPVDSQIGAFGAGDVAVDFFDFSFAGLDSLTKDFKVDMAGSDASRTHHLEYLFESGEPPLPAFETVINSTGDTWGSFVIQLQFATFYASGEGGTVPLSGSAISVDDVGFQAFGGVDAGDVMVSITNFGDGAELVLDFGPDGLAADGAFALEFDLGAVLDGDGNVVDNALFDGFSMQETPFLLSEVIPAPGAAILAMLGFGFLGRVHRRVH